MFTKLAVPLDGSPLAEKALPYALRLATLLKAQLLLLKVSSFPIGEGFDFEQEAQIVKDTESYLLSVKKRITNSNSVLHFPPERVQTMGIYNRAEHEIPEITKKEKADLILMTTHGRSGLSLLLMGSVANAIIHNSTLPVISIRPPEKEIPPDTSGEPLALGQVKGPVVVTLTGSPEAEAALPPAMALAQQIGVPIHLLEVIPDVIPVPVGEMGVGYLYDEVRAAKELEQLRENAGHYLEEIQARVTRENLICLKVEKVGDPAGAIIEYASRVKPSLIVMATHARGRVGQVLLGSVAEEVMRQVHLPVMLVPIGAHAKSKATQVLSEAKN